MCKPTPKNTRLLEIYVNLLVYNAVTLEVLRQFNASEKTWQRDFHTLRDAGLIEFRWSKKNEAYVGRIIDILPTEAKNKIDERNCQQLRRLCALIKYAKYCPVSEAEAEFEGETYIFSNTYFDKSWYKINFPTVSTRTRQRDFKELGKIGINIYYDGAETREFIISYDRW
jgi:hypothetical protein